MTGPALSNPSPSPTDRSRVRRTRERGFYDRATILRILDCGLHCHVGFLADGHPFVIPTMYWHDENHLYFHGSRASRMMRAAEGRSVCVTVTHFDGLVLARSAFHHSANYRSVSIFGTAEPIDEAGRAVQLEHLMERLFPGRWRQLRPVRRKELKATRVLRVALSEASAKIRTGPPIEDPKDSGWPAWAGVVAFQTIALPPQSDVHVKAGCAAPAFALPQG